MKNAQIQSLKVITRMNGEGKPVAFLADSIRNGHIKALIGNSREMTIVGLDYYKHTSPAEQEASAQMIKKLRRVLPDTESHNLVIRERLPRGYEVLASRPEGRKTRSEVAKERYKADIKASRKAERTAPATTVETAKQEVPPQGIKRNITRRQHEKQYVTIEMFNQLQNTLNSLVEHLKTTNPEVVEGDKKEGGKK